MIHIQRSSAETSHHVHFFVSYNFCKSVVSGSHPSADIVFQLYYVKYVESTFMAMAVKMVFFVHHHYYYIIHRLIRPRGG